MLLLLLPGRKSPRNQLDHFYILNTHRPLFRLPPEMVALLHTLELAVTAVPGQGGWGESLCRLRLLLGLLALLETVFLTYLMANTTASRSLQRPAMFPHRVLLLQLPSRIYTHYMPPRRSNMRHLLPKRSSSNLRHHLPKRSSSNMRRLLPKRSSSNMRRLLPKRSSSTYRLLPKRSSSSKYRLLVKRIF